MRRLALLLAALLAGVAPARAQPAEALSDSAAVSLLTVPPGEAVYSLFGHSAFRIADPATGLDRTYNFGTFDFDQPYFVLRFARGRLDYVLDTAPYDHELRKYAYLRRPIIEQRLAMPPEAVRALYAMLETNRLPENRAYRYDFFYDNCSTRLLAALDRALAAAGLPPVALPEAEAEATFRELLDPYLVGEPLLRLGIHLGLGLPTDRTATPREATFLPEELMRQLDGATVGGRPLVAATDTVLAVPGYTGPQPAFPWPLVAGWVLFGLGLAATFRGRATGRAGSRPGRTGDAVAFAVVGLAGTILALLWFGTEHAVTGPNLHLMWAWPPHLAAAWWLRKPTLPRGLRTYLIATGIVTAATALAWFFLPQAFPAPALPLALLVALRAGARAFPPTAPS